MSGDRQPDDSTSVPLRKVGALRELYDNFRYVFFSAVVSIIVGVTIPVLLVCWHNSKEITKQLQLSAEAEVSMTLADRARALVSLEMIATIFCGPGAVVLSAMLFSFLSHNKQNYGADSFLKTGLFGGAALSFFNFPGLLSGTVLGDSGPMVVVRVGLLFIVAGATCGAWTGWQVYRSAHRDAPFLPRYRLSTLLGLVFAWALLLAIFAPSSHS